MPSSACQTCALDRKSTRLNSSHGSISYAVFCLKKPTPDLGKHVSDGFAASEIALKRKDQRYVFFFNDTATTEIYTLSLHDALPISFDEHGFEQPLTGRPERIVVTTMGDRKSTRLNSSHGSISYAVFCLKTKQH